MKSAMLRFPVVCPKCGEESLARFPIDEIVPDLMNGRGIVLQSTCHSKVWAASDIEVEQIREYLGCVLD